MRDSHSVAHTFLLLLRLTGGVFNLGAKRNLSLSFLVPPLVDQCRASPKRLCLSLNLPWSGVTG